MYTLIKCISLPQSMQFLDRNFEVFWSPPPKKTYVVLILRFEYFQIDSYSLRFHMKSFLRAQIHPVLQCLSACKIWLKHLGPFQRYCKKTVLKVVAGLPLEFCQKSHVMLIVLLVDQYMSDRHIWWRYLKVRQSYYNMKIFGTVVLSLNFLHWPVKVISWFITFFILNICAQIHENWTCNFLEIWRDKHSEPINEPTNQATNSRDHSRARDPWWRLWLL